MSPVDTIVPLLQTPWTHRTGISSIIPLPGLKRETISHLQSDWAGFLTADMHKLLQFACGLSATPLGNIDFTGRWYTEEPLSLFRPCLTLTIDEKGRRWIAEVNKPRGLPGPVWCIVPAPRVALFIDRDLGDFLLRLHRHARRGDAPEWLSILTTRARQLWAHRYARAIAVPVALDRLREIRGWLARLPMNAWIYDLRAPTIPRGLPYGIAPDSRHLFRCGRLPVFAILAAQQTAKSASNDDVASQTPQAVELSPPSEMDLYNTMVTS